MKLVIKRYTRKRVGSFTTTEERILIADPNSMVIFPDGSVGLAGVVDQGTYRGSVPVKPEDLEVTLILEN